MTDSQSFLHCSHELLYYFG